MDWRDQIRKHYPTMSKASIEYTEKAIKDLENEMARTRARQDEGVVYFPSPALVQGYK